MEYVVHGLLGAMRALDSAIEVIDMIAAQPRGAQLRAPGIETAR